MRKESNDWKKAVTEELNSIKKNEVWTTVDRLMSKGNGEKPNIIDSK